MTSFSQPPFSSFTTPPNDWNVEEIRARLNRALPDTPYVNDAMFAEIIGLSVKTLANRRSVNPNVLPRPIRLCGNKALVYPRFDLLEWLVKEEVRARTTTLHRCK